MPFEPEDQTHLTAAEGFAELGMYLDANLELEEMDADVRHLPEVLAIRVQIYRGLERWELMHSVAKKLAQYDPENVQWIIWWAFATRRAESLEAARLILVNALETIPEEPTVLFNLACYECQLGNVPGAKGRLARALSLDDRLRSTALQDEDLAPLWDSLACDLGSDEDGPRT